MGRFLDINLEGDRALFRKLRALHHPAFERVVSKAARESMERMKSKMVQKVESGLFQESTGRLAQSMRQAKIVEKQRSRGRNEWILVMGPTPQARKAIEELISQSFFTGPLDIFKALTSRTVLPEKRLMVVGIRNVRTGTFYPAKVELGTRHSRPKSFMRSTFLENRFIELERIGKAISRGIDRILGPLER